MVALGGITLPDDTLWVDEWDYTVVASSQEFTLGGILIIEYGDKKGGRPVTLEAGWLVYSDVQALEGIRDIMGHQMQLELFDGRIYQVVFRQEDTPLEIKPIIPRPNYGTGVSYFDATIRLQEL